MSPVRSRLCPLPFVRQASHLSTQNVRVAPSGCRPQFKCQADKFEDLSDGLIKPSLVQQRLPRVNRRGHPARAVPSLETSALEASRSDLLHHRLPGGPHPCPAAALDSEPGMGAPKENSARRVCRGGTGSGTGGNSPTLSGMSGRTSARRPVTWPTSGWPGKFRRHWLISLEIGTTLGRMSFRRVISPGCFGPESEWVTSLGELAQVRTPRERITPSTQRYTSLACNSLRNRSSQFGAAGSDGQIVQGGDEMIWILDDIELNPVQRGWVVCREEWRFSFGQDRSFLSPDQVSQPLTNNLLAKVRASEAHSPSDRFPTCRKKPRRSCQRAEERRAVGGGGRPTGSKTCRTVFAALPGRLPWQTAGSVPGKI